MELEVKMQTLQLNNNMSYEREIKELKEKYNINISLKGKKHWKIKNYIRDKIMKINDLEIEEEIKSGKKTKLMNEYNKKYIEKFHFEEARAIFMMVTRMIDVKSNFKNKYRNLGLECEICKVEENTQHLFKCKKYYDLNEKIKGETLQEILKNNNEEDIANVMKKIIGRKDDEKKENETKKKIRTNTAPHPKGLSLPDGRV